MLEDNCRHPCVTLVSNSRHLVGPVSWKNGAETSSAVLYSRLTSWQFVHLGFCTGNASISPGNAKQGVINVLCVSAPSEDKKGFIISMSLIVPQGTCPGSYLQSSLFDPAGFHDSLQPLVDLYLLLYCKKMSYSINKRRACFDWLKWHHTGISVTVVKKNVSGESNLDKQIQS